jgi:hypothetical protein
MVINKNISKRNENVNTKNKEGAIFAKKNLLCSAYIRMNTS